MARRHPERAQNGRMAVISCTEREEPTEDRIVDAMTDILHYARSRGLNPRTLIERAMRHYIAGGENPYAKDPGAI